MAAKKTSARVATTASEILRDERYGKAAKTTAGSALSQREPAKKSQAKKSQAKKK